MTDIQSLLELLRCPQTHEPLTLAPSELVQRINARISRRALEDHAGERVAKKVDGALLSSAGTIAYPIRRGVPNLLIDDSIPLEQL